MRVNTEAIVLGERSISRSYSVNPCEVPDARRLFEKAGVKVLDSGQFEVPSARAGDRLGKLWRAAQVAAGCKPAENVGRPDPTRGKKQRAEKLREIIRRRKPASLRKR